MLRYVMKIFEFLSKNKLEKTMFFGKMNQNIKAHEICEISFLENTQQNLFSI